MSVQEWIEQSKRLPERIQQARVLYFATTATMTDMSDRIWKEGKLTDGSTLKYKQYELYAYKPPSPKAVTGKGKTGKNIKGGWYPSYVAYKDQQDRPDTPFELTGDLRISWFNGATPTPQEKNAFLCTIELPEKEFRKAEGLAKEKGPFLELTDGELKQHVVYLSAAYKELVLDKQ